MWYSRDIKEKEMREVSVEDLEEALKKLSEEYEKEYSRIKRG